MFISFACRLSPEQAAKVADTIATPGVHEIPTTVLCARQIRLDTDVQVPCTLTIHRGSRIPVISLETAAELVESSKAKWLPQRALVQTIDDYLKDKDIAGNPEKGIPPNTKEIARVEAYCAQGGRPLVLVAIIGGARSALAVCRNIVSGCQNPETLVADAKAAMEAADDILVE